MTPLVSVLMPAFNHAAYVAAAVESVLAQDYPRIELAIVDDGSGDGTPEILRSLLPACERRCERVTLECQENRGTCRTVNRLLDLARGEFCLVLASDDQLLPGALTALLRPLLADADVGVAVGENELMDGDGRRCGWDANRQAVYGEAQGAVFPTLNAYLEAGSGVDRFGDGFGAYAALLRSNHVANGCLIRRSALDRCARLTPEAPLEDYWLHLQLAKVTRYRSVREPTFRYRWHAANTSRAIGRMAAMTRLTLEHEAACFRDTLPAADRQALEATLALWRRRLLALVPESAAGVRESVGRLGVPADVVPVPDGAAALERALAAADLRGYGFVAYLADGRFLPDRRAWRRLEREFRAPGVECVAGRVSLVARASAVAAARAAGLPLSRLRRPGRWRRLVDFMTGRFG
ncbi:MAG: glycosyltransferase family 2 protein [Kiritimatiellia bacterium]